MEAKLTKIQRRLIKEHNAKMQIIADTSKVTGLSQATLHYCAHVGMIGMPWVKLKNNQ